VPYDLEDYWTQVCPEITEGQPWRPVKGLEPFNPSSPPNCGNQSTEGYVLFYCVPDDYIAWDNIDTMPTVYQQGGDYAVATLLATQLRAGCTDQGCRRLRPEDLDPARRLLRGLLHGERHPLDLSR
jgi:hypothetical protein